ncbi:MAG: hypothetical protein KKB31_02595 [Nanoarchaeota archaeon]|nr:hypothetical protein [Nanoarchaeota archaeon]
MIKNKKGLSTVVTTLIIILLVLVAIGIIWVVIRGVIEEGTSGIDYSVKCVDTDVRVTAATCNVAGDVCSLTFLRQAGSDDIGGVMAVFVNNTGASTATALNIDENIPLLTTKVQTPLDSGILSPTEVRVNAYFDDTSGQPYICSLTNKFSVTTV